MPYVFFTSSHVYLTFPKEYFKYITLCNISQALFYFPENAFPASAIPNEPSVTTTKDV